jgi:ribosomal protein L7/L12
MDIWMWVVGLIVLVVIGGWALKSMRPSAPAPPPGPLTTDSRSEIDALVASGNKIAAIKRLRELSPMSLQEAKDRIDTWATGAVVPPPAPAADAGAGLPPEVRTEIDQLLAAGQPISAIKVYRERTGVGLAEAKRAIDGWAPRPPL